jgi:LemA protein
MKKPILALIALVIIVAVGYGLFYMYGASVRDNAVAKQEAVKASWGQVQAAYQNRADLIGNLVATVKAAAANEKQILIGVTEARSGIQHYADSVGNIIATQKQLVQQAQSPAQIEQSDLMIMNAYRGFRGFMTENYPTVQSTTNFTMLQTQIEGTENRVRTERNRYNEAVQEYNSYIRGTWRKKGLGIVDTEGDDLKPREMFEAKPGSEDAPVVKF